MSGYFVHSSDFVKHGEVIDEEVKVLVLTLAQYFSTCRIVRITKCSPSEWFSWQKSKTCMLIK